MTSRPATPTSETPETDAAWKAQRFTKIGGVDLSEAPDVSRSLERRLALAQARVAELERLARGLERNKDLRAALKDRA